jgi:chloride channel protein, CIC family
LSTPNPKPNENHTPIDELADFINVDRRLIKISLLCIIVGVISAFVADALLTLIGLFTNLFYYGRISLQFVSPAGNQLGLAAIVVPAVGGLIVGLMARFGSERIRGHGIPEAIESILVNKSKIEPRVAVLKPISSAISIGSGGPFGAEGPIIMTGGAFGSVFAQFLKLASTERKTLLVAGAAGGMAATFNTPVSAIMLSVELLLFEWKPRSLIPVGVASITATLVRGVIISTNPLFPIASTPIPSVPIVVSAVLVGAVAGLAATLLTYFVYGAEDAFRKLPIHWMWWPIIGGLVVGVGGLVAPRALGVGYDTIDAMLLGNVAIDVIAVLAIVKATIWAISLGSGTSGGVLAPLLIIGAALGALESHALPFGTPPLWVLVSMGAMLGGMMRAPFTGAIFCLELTHDVNALFPLMAAALMADGVTVFTMKRSILTEKVARKGVHVAREYSVDMLEFVPVRSVMHQDFTILTAESSLQEAIIAYRKSNGKAIGFPVIDATGSVVGYLPSKVIHDVLGENPVNETPIRDIVVGYTPVAFADEPLRVAVDKMAAADAQGMPVVDHKDPKKILGVLSKDDVFAARVLWFAEEKNRERVLTMSAAPIKKAAKRAIHTIRNAANRAGREPDGQGKTATDVGTEGG